MLKKKILVLILLRTSSKTRQHMFSLKYKEQEKN